jgi:prolyl oligopeptidase
MVADPYRSLEDLDSADTRSWIEEQDRLTSGFLSSIPQRDSIKKRLTQLWNYERLSIPFKEGNRYFYFKNDGLQNHSVLYTAKSLTDKPKVVIDPNTLSKDGTIALSTYSISKSGKLIAYGLSSAGSDWVEIKVRDIDTGQDLPDLIKWVKFSHLSWTKDNKGFFYSRYDEVAEEKKLNSQSYFQKLYYHKIGTPQSEDILVYHRPDQRDWFIAGQVSEDGKYLIISMGQGTDDKTRIYYKDLKSSSSEIVKLIDNFEAEYRFIGSDGSLFYFTTNLQTPMNRLVAIDIRRPEKQNWRELIAESKDKLEEVQVAGDYFIASYLKDAHTKLKIFSNDGIYKRDIELPGVGTASMYGRPKDAEVFYSFTNYTTPNVIYRYDLKSGKQTIFRKPKVDFNPDVYESKQVFYKSKDGTLIPMFIAHKKGIRLDGSNPTYLYGYGGFNIVINPKFSIDKVLWMEMGGVYACANIRGGGEYGKEWHEAGMKLRKQNTFDDFIAAAEWLISNRYTSSAKLAIGGGSNGGLLVGAVLTQRPDLIGAAVPEVGVLDMLRFNKLTVGWAWEPDYGSPENEEEFKVLYSYSPLHNIKKGTSYPPTLIMTADHDDRVWPGHSFKFGATLQEAQAGTAPILLRVEKSAGHGAGTPTDKAIEKVTDRFAFLSNALGMN